MDSEKANEVDNVRDGVGFAVLVDAENVSLSRTREALMGIEVIGPIGIVVVVADRTRIQPVEELQQHYPVQLIDVPMVKKQGQTADVVLAIQATKLLAQGIYQRFAIISSDQDFYYLIVELKNAGKFVVAAGKSNTGSTYQSAADVFIELGRSFVDRKLSKDDYQFLCEARWACQGGWMSLGKLGTILRDTIPGFNPRNFGAKNLTQLIRRFPKNIELAWERGDWFRAKCRFID